MTNKFLQYLTLYFYYSKHENIFKEGTDKPKQEKKFLFRIYYKEKAKYNLQFFILAYINREFLTLEKCIFCISRQTNQHCRRGKKNKKLNTAPRHMLNSELHSMYLVSKDCYLLFSQTFPAAKKKKKKAVSFVSRKSFNLRITALPWLPSEIHHLIQKVARKHQI